MMSGKLSAILAKIRVSPKFHLVRLDRRLTDGVDRNPLTDCNSGREIRKAEEREGKARRKAEKEARKAADRDDDELGFPR